MKKNLSAQPLTRRDFLQATGLVLGASALALTGCSNADAPTPQPTEVETPSYHYEEDSSMNQRILVAYATRTGSTVGVASAIGERLSARGYTVDVKPIKDNPSLDGYDRFVLGSAVNGAQWLPEAVEFVGDHRAALNAAPTALFCVHIMNLGDDPAGKKNRLAYLDNVRKLVKPVEESWFAGIGMNPAEMSGIERLMARLFKITAEGDCRDWTKIHAWGDALFG